MAYAPLPKLVPIGSPRVPPDETTTAIFMDLLQTQAMKNILTEPDCVSEPDALEELDDSVEEFIEVTPEISEDLESIGSLEDAGYYDEPIYLPSKGDSDPGIILQPIKPTIRECGHSEPCETIICDVIIQQCIDEHGSSPLLATNIEESEIDAPVARHCDTSRCDAVSIDHNRCRRLIIKLNRCDIPSSICDICGACLKTRKTRIHHRACKRKDEYRHNKTTGAQVLKDRMREREVQMMEELRIKRSVHVDAENANEEAAEWLKNNSELDVIATASPTHQVLTIEAVSGPIPGLTPLMPNIVIPQNGSGVYLNNQTCYEDNPDASLYPDIDLITPQPQNQILLTTVPQTAYPLAMNEFAMPVPIPLAPKPAIMPFKVVPIANYKSEPSERDREAGLPKFCIIANNPLQVQSMFNLQQMPTLQTIAANITTSNRQPIQPAPMKPGSEKTPEEIKKYVKVGKRRGKYKKRVNLKKKPYGCTHCGKRFSAGWYFKEHLDKHKGVETRVQCEICKTVYESVDELTKHMNTQHNDKARGDDQYEERGEFSCYNCETNFDTAEDMHNHTCLNGTSSDIEILHEEINEIDDEVEEIQEVEEEENDRVNGSIKINGDIEDKQSEKVEQNDEENRRLRRRKSKHSCRVDFDMPQEVDVNSSPRKKRKRKSIRR